MQIETTVRNHLTPVRMAVINKSTNECRWTCKDAVLAGLATEAAIIENSMEIPQGIKNRTITWLRNSTSAYLSKESHNTDSERHKHPCVHCAVIYTSQDMETN